MQDSTDRHSTAVLDVLRDVLLAVQAASQGNTRQCSKIVLDTWRKIDAAIGPSPERGPAPSPLRKGNAFSPQQQTRSAPQPQSSYDPLAGDELYRQQHARIEAAREARTARQLEQIRQRQGNGIQPMPHGQADDFADD